MSNKLPASAPTGPSSGNARSRATSSRPAAGWALLGSELKVLFRRWRTWAMLAALAAVPVLIALAVRLS
ncbi:MAG TPA: ABC transporter permease, partial [Arthrobacter sp.]|nr:ABC transporter permease [Arthrobacter sp.]